MNRDYGDLQITHEKKGKWSEPNLHEDISSR